MAIDMKSMYIQKAHRLSLYSVSPSVGNVYAGQLFHLNDDGEWEYADGTRKAYPAFNNRYPGQGLGSQNERLEGRDDVSAAGKLTCLMGNYEIGTDQYDDSVTYTHGSALGVTGDGQVTLFDEATMKAEFIVGFVTQPPEEQGDFLRFHGN